MNFTLEQLITKIVIKQYIDERCVKQLCKKVTEILKEEPNLVRVSSPITICGDIHGQFHDLLQLFRVGGQIPYVTYMFIGDFVDRGLDSVETLLLLLIMKIRYRSKIILLRGNHQSGRISQIYGFYDECLRKYGTLNVWRDCTEVFNYLPLCSIVNDKVFCVHGGLSPKLNHLQDIAAINRCQQIPHIGLMSDLVWSDPDLVDGWVVSPRGSGFIFGEVPADQFLRNNNLSLICRAHQLVMEGYKKMFNKKLVTVWSAPNYCYRCNNVAAILQLDEYVNEYYKVYEASEEQSIPIRRNIPEYFL